MMKNLLLVVNILALTLPFLAAEVQNQDQPTNCENDEKYFIPKAVPIYIPVNYFLKSDSHYSPIYYQQKPAVPFYYPYMLHQYSTKPFVFRTHIQIPQQQVSSNIYTSPMLHPTSFVVVPPKKMQDKAIVPTTDIFASIDPTHIPTTEPTKNTVETPEVPTDVITKDTPETIRESITSPLDQNH
ncbi:PREDICTED: kappa-casein [Chrysochloris asiatica]|uniref:Kappa-casein n=1 Tax=Chrysochloris asiatica TaxID=185453 RepID=A0A9B0U0V6_CHRAS|nr:PREDICTED: kappa-casein [Chrysochloris asiatica]